MRPCEACSGRGYTHLGPTARQFCSACQGTGIISYCDWPERTEALVARARHRAVSEGWLEEVWDGEPGNATKVLRKMQSPDWRENADERAKFEATAAARGWHDPIDRQKASGE
jgi:DnaJ-class molecular chaperone